MGVTFRVQTRIAAPPERVFDLCRDIDVHLAGFAHTNEQAVGGVTTGLIGLGEEVELAGTALRAAVYGMTSRIVEYDRPRWFTDEQTRGPFKHYNHVPPI